MQAKPLCIVPRPEDLDGIAAHLGRRRALGQKVAVRAAESKLSVRPSIELVALFVDGAVVPATEQGEIRERGGASLSPVPEVMSLPNAQAAAREATAVVPVVQRSP